MIFIPTLGRVHEQHTYAWFNRGFLTNHEVVIVCPRDEYIGHAHHGRKVLACDVKGIGNVRQWIMEYARDHDINKVIMCDDDHVHWYRRISPTNYNLRNATKPECYEIFDRIYAKLDEYAMVGVAARAGSNRFFPKTEVEAIRQNNIHGIRTDVYFEVGAKFNRLPLMEDFDVILTFLENGYPNLLLVDVAWGQVASNAPGGCSTYRNNKLQSESARALQTLHPGLVRIHTKKAKTWGDMSERDDVIIQWKKALNASIAE